jgi:hypothetical protein
VYTASATRAAIYYNAYLKKYPDGRAVLLVADRSIFREAGWEERKRKPAAEQRAAECEAGGEAEAEAVLQQAEAANEDEPCEGKPSGDDRARRRARSAVRDLAMCNDFVYFVTFTLDKSKVNRYDVAEITRKLNNWLDNNVRRHGLKYVLVPELHKDGAVHFHGLINAAEGMKITDSGTIARGSGKPRRPRSEKERQQWLEAGGHEVYNVGAWGLGFSTAIKLYGERGRAISYVCKYISKTADKVGGRWYYSGGALSRPSVSVFAADYSASKTEARGGVFTIDALAAECCRLEFESMEEFDNVRKSLGIR